MLTLIQGENKPRYEIKEIDGNWLLIDHNLDLKYIYSQALDAVMQRIRLTNKQVMLKLVA